jgi:hypothetical protein
VSLLGSLKGGAKSIVDTVEDALSLPSGTPADQALAAAAARAQVQTDLAALEAKVLKSARLSAEDVEHALSYYTRSKGTRDERVGLAVAGFKAVVGKYVVTQRRILDIMRGTFEIQAATMEDKVRAAVRKGAVRGLPDLQRFLQAPSLAAALQRDAERFTLEESGMSIQEIDALTNNPEFKDVS